MPPRGKRGRCPKTPDGEQGGRCPTTPDGEHGGRCPKTPDGKKGAGARRHRTAKKGAGARRHRPEGERSRRQASRVPHCSLCGAPPGGTRYQPSQIIVAGILGAGKSNHSPTFTFREAGTSRAEATSRPRAARSGAGRRPVPSPECGVRSATPVRRAIKRATRGARRKSGRPRGSRSSREPARGVHAASSRERVDAGRLR